MANLSDETIQTVFQLQQRLLQLIQQAIITEFTILEQYGETETSIIALEQLQNVRERARNYYTRLYRLLLQIAESPMANSATVDLLDRSIRETRSLSDAGQATIVEARRDFNQS